MYIKLHTEGGENITRVCQKAFELCNKLQTAIEFEFNEVIATAIPDCYNLHNGIPNSSVYLEQNIMKAMNSESKHSFANSYRKGW